MTPLFGYILFSDDGDILCGVHRNVSTTSGSSLAYGSSNTKGGFSPKNKWG